MIASELSQATRVPSACQRRHSSKVHNDGPVQLSVVYTIVLTSVTQAGLPRFAEISQTFSRDTKRDLTP